MSFLFIAVRIVAAGALGTWVLGRFTRRVPARWARWAGVAGLAAIVALIALRLVLRVTMPERVPSFSG